jgi:signal peptidase I
MEPNYKNLERVISEKVSLKSTDIKRGEVVVFRDPQTPQIHLIKRVVGIPGDNFKIKEGNVYINNTVLEEPYLAENTQTLEGPVFEEGVDYFVPDNKYILLGDNRGESMDSRTFGYVAKELIESRPVLVVYPLMDIRFLR